MRRTTRTTTLLTTLLALMLTGLAGSALAADTYEFTLHTGYERGQFVYIGEGGDIDGVINPNLMVTEGSTVTIHLINNDAMEHDIYFPDLEVKSDSVFVPGETTSITFTVGTRGDLVYYCTIAGHREIGMEGIMTVGRAGIEIASDAPSLAKDPTDIPAPVGDRGPMTLDLELVTTERMGRLADGTNYTFWTFNDTVPGPFVRIRVGDTVNVSLHNEETSRYVHSVDFHAVTGPGGGATVTQTPPGMTTEFSFQAIRPGLYVYHCATASVAHHITQGMYGLILVEPEGGLPEVDHEFYVMQGELYTIEPFGTRGDLNFDITKMMDERAEWLFFNGAPDALTVQYPLEAEVGDTVRIFFGVGGPNYVSSFHVIGEIFDTVYVEAGSMKNHNVQTTLVPAGGATMVEFAVEVPGDYLLVDHSLSRAERGLAGILRVHGEENHEIFRGQETPGHGH